MFNSDEYAWKDLQVVIGGRLVTGIRGLKYKVTRTVTDIYGSGDRPHTRTKGNKSYTGEIKLLQSEVEALQMAAGPGRDLTDISFDVACSYATGIEFGDHLRTADPVRCYRNGKRDGPERLQHGSDPSHCDREHPVWGVKN